MSNTPLDSFVALSSILTGIDKDKLAPPLDPVNIKQAYFDQAQSKAGSVFTQLLALYNQNQAKPPADIANIVLSDATVGNLARTVMLMWYLGSWYEPSDPQKYALPPGKTPEETVVSASAYTQGWVWRVAQAHPMGFSQFTFGYWGKQPPSLSDFIGTGGKK